METQGYHLHILLLLVLVSVAHTNAISPITLNPLFNRSSFPVGFIFGTASSAYQYEGASSEGGRGPSIWDTYTHKYPDKIADRSSGDVAVDSYHRYKEDVRIMKKMGLDAYRFSISWSRILPNGKLSGGVNLEGIKYYNNLIDELLANGLQPYVTIFHWDLPQALEDEYGGFLSPNIVDDFRDYAEVCFGHFGNRVKNWITLNEPWTYSNFGYATGLLAPGRCSDWQQLNCTGGDSAVEPYVVAHHLLLAHAAAVKLYRQKYQANQKGVIGITLVSHWMVPFSNERNDQDAAQRALDFMFGWFMDPITSGEYPKSMQSLVGDRLPKFSKEQSEMLKGSFDFLGLNYYTANFAATDAPKPGLGRPSYLTDSRVILSTERYGVPIGQKTATDWLHVYPKGFFELLIYIKRKYNNPIIYITENGVSEFNNATLSAEASRVDIMRVEYYDQHLSFLRDAIIGEGVNVNGYFAWSLLDNFEWADGYTIRFGIYYARNLRREIRGFEFWEISRNGISKSKTERRNNGKKSMEGDVNEELKKALKGAAGA
ncbi:Glycoside hydrolase, family 1 [Corchorus olitorius]|uniref:Glycoside hydrolase, family 1 n=1 Tax=Corchorus olitorius TaxID=93759 RepID=A0A1R3FVE4_9ROSI|nr:Glycoside hydrolase, family 1 [Corchorus olitorius]